LITIILLAFILLVGDKFVANIIINY
jgi:hypothetical protein